jgi:hypothetical protein
MKIFLKKLIQKIRAASAWSHVIKYLLCHRGKQTYGSAQLKDLVDRYIIEKTATLENYQQAERSIQTLARLLTPINVSGLTRIGATRDGGYVGLLESVPQCLISGGAGKNIDFEVELALLGSDILLFDPTVKKLPKNHSRITHVPLALCSNDSRQFKKGMNLSTALELEKQDHNSKFWLKLDIEGSEYELLDEKLEILDSFEQVFIEFHDVYKILGKEFRDRFLRIISYLNSNFYLVSINSNNWQNIFNAGYAFTPVTFEATFLKKSVPVEIISEQKYVDLLTTNNSERPPIPRFPFLYLNAGDRETRKRD